MTYKIVVTDTTYLDPDMPVFKKQFEGHSDVNITIYDWLDDPELLRDADAIVVQKWYLDDKVAESLNKDKPVIAIRTGVGYENIDAHALADIGVMVSNIPDYGVHNVASQALMYILTLGRTFNEYQLRMSTNRDLELGRSNSGKDGWSSNSKINGIDFAESVLGIVGFGRIGSELYRIAKEQFRGKIIICDPYITKKRFQEAGVTVAEDIDKTLKTIEKSRPAGVRNLDLLVNTIAEFQGDAFVSFHVPRIEEKQDVYVRYARGYKRTGQTYEPTVNLFTMKEIELIGNRPNKEDKKKRPWFAYIVSNCRGRIVNEAYLAQALKEGIIAGAALDVFETEPLPMEDEFKLRKMLFAELPPDHMLREYGQEKYNVALTPHSASAVFGTHTNMETSIAKEILRVKAGENPQNLVNPGVLKNPEYRRRQQYKAA